MSPEIQNIIQTKATNARVVSAVMRRNIVKITTSAISSSIARRDAASILELLDIIDSRLDNLIGS